MYFLCISKFPDVKDDTKVKAHRVKKNNCCKKGITRFSDEDKYFLPIDYPQTTSLTDH